ncbi:winged helix-turn-helix transcriptional regulator [Streptomyces sp. NPDC085612]|uniref:winged helix-turn-helix transcriptional regulator n=1 Tax=Streptomyces sp. NPDC085612 TaxID=3365732 RepID=UPI0037D1573D
MRDQAHVDPAVTDERQGRPAQHRRVQHPVHVDYRLTDLGSSLAALLSSVKLWAENHFDEVSTHREAYDRAAAAS